MLNGLTFKCLLYYQSVQQTAASQINHAACILFFHCFWIFPDLLDLTIGNWSRLFFNVKFVAFQELYDRVHPVSLQCESSSNVNSSQYRFTLRTAYLHQENIKIVNLNDSVYVSDLMVQY